MNCGVVPRHLFLLHDYDHPTKNGILFQPLYIMSSECIILTELFAYPNSITPLAQSYGLKLKLFIPPTESDELRGCQCHPAVIRSVISLSSV
ncbi:hypothetical protein P692DRAFT_20104448 [Suillus brevipes Sb2]|jgi:hypothetical protein|nr:hypothetical protein P692DRAFT_20104448 [Suillus brevipes Sb2]